MRSVYGCANDCDYSRFSGGLAPSNNFERPESSYVFGTANGRTYRGIEGDDQPFDPSPFLEYPKVCLFGYQFFANKLPTGTVLVWNKKRPNQLGTFLSDAELAWVKGGRGCYLFNHVWHGFDRESERGKTKHPTQKPVALFRWVFDRMKLAPGDLVFDPFMGSGPIAKAAQEAGLRYVGCEIVPEYFEKAVERHIN